MNQEKIFIQNRTGEQLVGLAESEKSQEGKRPAVILVHGFGANKSEYGMFDDLSAALVNKGFLTYRFDFSGCGESEGDYSQTSLTKLTSDLRVIVDFVKAQPNVDAEKIGTVAMSLGTSVSVALHTPEIQAYVLLGSVVHPYDLLKKLFEKYTFNPNGISVRKMSRDEREIRMGPQFWKNFNNYDLSRMISEIQKPICFIHGGKDTKAPISEAETFFQNTNEPKKLVTIKNAGHGFYEPDERQKMTDETLRWLTKYLSS